MRTFLNFLVDALWLALAVTLVWQFPIATLLIEVVSAAATFVLYQVERGWM